MNKSYLDNLINKANSGNLSALREYGEMQVLGRYSSKDAVVSQNMERAKLFLTRAALKGDEESHKLLIKYNFQTEETLRLQKDFVANKTKFKYFLKCVKHGYDKELRQYGELLFYGYLKSNYIHRDKRHAKEVLMKSALGGNGEAVCLLFEHELLDHSDEWLAKKALMKSALGGNEKAECLLFKHKLLSPDKFEHKKLEYEFDKRLKKRPSISWQRFFLSIATGVVSFFITRIMVGEGMSGTGAIGVATVAVILAILAATTS